MTDPKTSEPSTQSPLAAANKQRRRARNTWLKRSVLLVTAVGALAALVWAMLPKPLAVDVDTLSQRELRVTVEEDGKTRVKDRYVVSSPLLANLARIELSAGDSVTPQTVLARLLPLSPGLLDARSRAEAEAQLSAAKAAEQQAHATIARASAALDFARSEVMRLRKLQSGGAIDARSVELAELQARSAQEDVTSATFASKVADHQLVLARAALGRFETGKHTDAEPIEVLSPVSGRVLRVFHESEGVVQPGTPLLELGDPAALEVVVDVLTTDAVHVTPGTRAFIERWGGEAKLQAHVRTIEPSAVTRVSALGVEEQRVNVVLDLDSKREDWMSLGDGYRVEASLVVWDGGLRPTVPAGAVFRHGDDLAVYRVQDGVAHLTPIAAGRRNQDLVEVLSGLSDGAQIIVHPSDRIEDGSAVTQR